MCFRFAALPRTMRPATPLRRTRHWLGKFIATRRAPKVRKLYDAIGGGSPILKWTTAQGEVMCRRLDEMSPDTAPHTFYVAFRYAPPFADDALRKMKLDGITRAVAFTQYPLETLSELDIEYAELAHKLGMPGFKRAPALNARQEFLDALADIVHEHLQAGAPWSSQYRQRCPGCVNAACRWVPSRVATSHAAGGSRVEASAGATVHAR